MTRLGRVLIYKPWEWGLVGAWQWSHGGSRGLLASLEPRVKDLRRRLLSDLWNWELGRRQRRGVEALGYWA